MRILPSSGGSNRQEGVGRTSRPRQEGGAPGGGGISRSILERPAKSPEEREEVSHFSCSIGPTSWERSVALGSLLFSTLMGPAESRKIGRRPLSTWKLPSRREMQNLTVFLVVSALYPKASREWVASSASFRCCWFQRGT